MPEQEKTAVAEKSQGEEKNTALDGVLKDVEKQHEIDSEKQNAHIFGKSEEENAEEKDAGKEKGKEESKEEEKGAEEKDAGPAKEEKDEEKAGEEEASTEAAPEIGPELMKRARFHGWSRPEADAMGAKLEGMLDVLDSKYLQKDPEVPEKEKEDESSKEKEKEAEIPDEFKLDPDAYEAPIVKAIALIPGLQAEIKQLKEDKVEAAKQADKNEANIEMSDWFDGEISKLGEDYEGRLGKGEVADISKAHFEARDSVYTDMVSLMRSRPKTSRAELFKKAISLLPNDKEKKQAPEEKEKAAKKRTGQIISKPTRHKNADGGADKLDEVLSRIKGEQPDLG